MTIDIDQDFLDFLHKDFIKTPYHDEKTLFIFM